MDIYADRQTMFQAATAGYIIYTIRQIKLPKDPEFDRLYVVWWPMMMMMISIGHAVGVAADMRP